MKKYLLLLVLLCQAVGWKSEDVSAWDETDANIVTAIDISDSVSRRELDRMISALAVAITSRPVVEAIQNGPNGRIGFSVFAWHHYRYSFVDWIPIATSDDARVAATLIKKRILINVEPKSGKSVEQNFVRRTDISGAIDYAQKLLGKAPYATQRKVINIVGNGVDNVGESPRRSRSRFIGSGGTINGLVIGKDPSIADYYRRQVVGGRGAFVMAIAEDGDLVGAIRRKFVTDIAFLGSAGSDRRPEIERDVRHRQKLYQ